MTEMSCPERASIQAGENKTSKVWVALAVVLGFSIAVAGLLDLSLGGLPLGFIIPLLNEQATVSTIIFYSIIICGRSIYWNHGFRGTCR